MPMDQVPGPVLVHQIQQTLKPLVGVILPVSIAHDGRVGQHNVHAPRPPEAPPQPPDPAGHLGLRVLVGPSAVLHTPPQAQNAQALHRHQAVLHAVAALRRVPVIGLVVIPVDVEQGLAAHGHQEAEVFGVQVPAGEDQVDAVQAARAVVVPQVLALFIRQ